MAKGKQKDSGDFKDPLTFLGDLYFCYIRLPSLERKIFRNSVLNSSNLCTVHLWLLGEFMLFICVHNKQKLLWPMENHYFHSLTKKLLQEDLSWNNLFPFKRFVLLLSFPSHPSFYLPLTSLYTGCPTILPHQLIWVTGVDRAIIMGHPVLRREDDFQAGEAITFSTPHLIFDF